MIIIGFVVTVMIFSSFAIVFSNSGNNQNTSSKQILNLPEKSFTSNVVNKYQIDLSNLPSGNGYYQQLITLNNYDTYGINSNGSNIEFFSSNNTQLYAWIQSINSTSMQIWVKNFNQSSIMYLYVLQSYENLFNSNGYLGEAPQLSSVYGEYFNAPLVFGNATSPNAWDFAGTTLPSGFINSGTIYTQNNGLIFTGTDANGYMYYNENLGSASGYSMTEYGVIEGSQNNITAFGFIQIPISNHAGYNGIGMMTWNGGSTSTLQNPYGYMANNSGYLVTSVFPTFSTPAIWTVSVNSNSNDTFYLNNSNMKLINAESGLTSLYPSVAEFSSGAHAYNLEQPMKVYYMFISRSVSSMPTFNIGTGSVFQANSTADNTTYQHYQAFGEDSTNLTEGEYTYDIPDSFNSNYITIYYNPAWTIDYASYGFSSGTEATTNGYMGYLTFAGVSGIGTITMTFTEPLVIGQPLGTLSLGVLPSVAVDGNAFF